MTEKATGQITAAPPEPGQLFRHYKGGLYVVYSASVINATDGSGMVLYGHDGHGAGGSKYVRSLMEWMEEVRPSVKRYTLVTGPHPIANTDDAGRLGFFRHHPDPAVDYCVEVESIAGQLADLRTGHRDDRAGIDHRIEVALRFRVGGWPSAVAAKDRLRELATRLTAGDFDPPSSGDGDRGT